MTVDFCYKIMNYVMNKNQQGNLPPDKFNAIINQGQYSFIDYLLGEFQQYQYGRAQARVEFGQNRTVRQRLTPVIYGYNLTVDSTGFAPYPGDYQTVDAMWSFYGYNRIRYAQQNSLDSYVNSVIDPVATNPVYLIEMDGFRFFPNDIAQAKLNYVKVPDKIIWAYTLDANGRPVYDPVNSVDPVWYDTDCLEIIARALKMVGVNLQSAAILQYANDVKMNGQ